MAFDKQAYDQDFAKQNYDRVVTYVPKGKRDELKALAKREGLSVNDLIKNAVYRAYGLDLSK